MEGKDLHQSIINAIFKLEESNNYDEAKDLLINYLPRYRKIKDQTWKMDISPQAIISGE